MSRLVAFNSSLVLAASTLLAGCVSLNPSEVIMHRWHTIPWQIANPEITGKPIVARESADSMNGHVTLTKYDGKTLCLVANEPTAPRALVEAKKDLFRLAVARTLDELKEADPPPMRATSATVQSTYASVLGEGTISEVCFQATGPTLLTRETTLIRLQVGPTSDGKTSEIFWSLMDPDHPANEENSPGRVVRNRTF
jgi:hypothetical protein